MSSSGGGVSSGSSSGSSSSSSSEGYTHDRRVEFKARYSLLLT